MAPHSSAQPGRLSTAFSGLVNLIPKFSSRLASLRQLQFKTNPEARAGNEAGHPETCSFVQRQLKCASQAESGPAWQLHCLRRQTKEGRARGAGRRFPCAHSFLSGSGETVSVVHAALAQGKRGGRSPDPARRPISGTVCRVWEPLPGKGDEEMYVTRRVCGHAQSRRASSGHAPGAPPRP